MYVYTLKNILFCNALEISTLHVSENGSSIARCGSEILCRGCDRGTSSIIKLKTKWWKIDFARQTSIRVILQFLDVLVVGRRCCGTIIFPCICIYRTHMSCTWGRWVTITDITDSEDRDGIIFCLETIWDECRGAEKLHRCQQGSWCEGGRCNKYIAQICFYYSKDGRRDFFLRGNSEWFWIQMGF